MYINNLLPVLIKFFFSSETKQTNQSMQANTQKGTQAQQHFSKSAGEIIKNTPLQRTNTPENPATANDKNNPEPGQPKLIPLPLKSDIFPKSYFYKVHDDEDTKRKNDHGEEQHKVAFGLQAPSLGKLYFFIIQQGKKLSIQCASSQYEATREIKNNFDELKDILKEKGWQDINCSCIHVENPENLPRMSHVNFIDLKI